MREDIGRSGASAPSGSQASPGAAKASPPPVSIPNATPRLSLWVDHRRRELRWEVANGPVLLLFPQVMTPDEIDELEQVLTIAIRGMRRTASGIEAASADETRSGSAEGESPAPKGDAQ